MTSCTRENQAIQVIHKENYSIVNKNYECIIEK